MVCVLAGRHDASVSFFPPQDLAVQAGHGLLLPRPEQFSGPFDGAAAQAHPTRPGPARVAMIDRVSREITSRGVVTGIFTPQPPVTTSCIPWWSRQTTGTPAAKASSTTFPEVSRRGW